MRKGFTLIELLIVLAVIAALMAVATPLALNAVKNAKASQVAQNFRNIKTAYENWFNTEKPTTIGNMTLQQLKDNGYLSSVPTGFNNTLTVADKGNGVYEVTIEYTAGDVDKNVLKKTLQDVDTTGDNPKLTFQVQKWW
ncbi:prepilin-type N-terminal cleavage/methylation domain-containing protein [Fervidobacterium changbaicum]|uniref:Type II secretion system protein n=1 Tax=Fervidobacterium changbaicum TaxID=310769 RepID=A0ABX5QTY4_9BACT|nr:type II secretion system protein [Fervidobacterium changbaicum]QAV33991.1 type II secretion system protein [Fervidobacterium changbaicum]SDH25963.1 prepilin-type N-terminal cleavage/methylation domain-containing protein [Fervidobacterium changbaicum]